MSSAASFRREPESGAFECISRCRVAGSGLSLGRCHVTILPKHEISEAPRKIPRRPVLAGGRSVPTQVKSSTFFFAAKTKRAIRK